MVSYSQPNKFGKSIITRFWAVLFQPVHPNSNVSHFWQIFLWRSALFLLKIAFDLENIYNIYVQLQKKFFSFTRVSCSRQTMFCKLIFSRCWGMLWQPMHPKSNIRLSRFFSSFRIALWFFLKTRFRVTNKNFKIIFAPSLGSLGVSWPTVVNW